MERKILIVDDEADIREILQFNLENAGFLTDCASSAEEALDKISSEYGLILLDVMMGGTSVETRFRSYSLRPRVPKMICLRDFQQEETITYLSLFLYRRSLQG